MRIFRLFLLIGGLFNLIMGMIFLSNRLLAALFHFALQAEQNLFFHAGVLFIPQDPLHLLLIHGFGAAAMILGASLIYSTRDPARWVAFILFDGVGRIVYATVMLVYVVRYSLLRVILLFGFFEMLLGLLYIIGCVLIAQID
jgi:hypothetical protein